MSPAGFIGPEVDEFGSLLCPSCGFNYLRHGAVTVFDRGEDAPYTRVTAVGPASVCVAEVESEACDNPSSRRDGLTIAFSCEGCAAGLTLALRQHKGQTFIEWLVEPPAA